MFPRFPSLPLDDRGVFRADHYVPEPPPTPSDLFGQIGLVLVFVLYMAVVITLIAWAFGGPVPG